MLSPFFFFFYNVLQVHIKVLNVSLMQILAKHFILAIYSQNHIKIVNYLYTMVTY